MSSPCVSRRPGYGSDTAARGEAVAYDPRIAIEGEGPPFVYVPGMDGTGLLFYRQIPELAHRFRVATYTLRDSATHMHTLVEDLSGVVAKASTSNEKAIVFGESFGGALSSPAREHRPHAAAGTLGEPLAAGRRGVVLRPRAA